MLLNLWQTITAHPWSYLGVLAGGIAVGYGQRGFSVQRRMQEQAQFFQGKLDAAIRESDERKFRVKTVEARLATLAPLEGQLRERDRMVLELTAAAAAESARHAAQVDEQAAAIRQHLAGLEQAHAMLQERDATLQARDGALADLSRRFAALHATPPMVVEKIVEVDRPVIVEKRVDVEKPVVIEKVVEVERLMHIAVPMPAPAPGPLRKAGDDLELIHGVGPKLASFLRERGITQFGQIARWQAADIERLEAELPQFKGRIRREGWVRSAATEHCRKYGREP